MDSEATRRMTAFQRRACELEESCIVFEGFNFSDQGRSRKFFAKFKNQYEANDFIMYYDSIFNYFESQINSKNELIKEYRESYELKKDSMKSMKEAYEEIIRNKNEEIERLYTENKKFMEHITFEKLSETIVLCVKCSQEVTLKDTK